MFKVKIDKDAEMKEHFIKLLVRAKGDSDKGDENIYTFNRRASIKVEGKESNKIIGIGITAVIIVLGLIVFKIVKRKK